MKIPKFETFKGDDGQFYFHLLALNSKLIVPSEGYTTKSMRLKGINAIRRNAPIALIVERGSKGVRSFVKAPKYETFLGENGQYYFHLLARNGKLIVPSEGYTTKAMRIKGINSIKRNAPVAIIVERKQMKLL